MLYIKSIDKLSDGTKAISVKIQSACCKDVYIYIEKSDGKIYLDGVEVYRGVYASIAWAKKLYEEGLRK